MSIYDAAMRYIADGVSTVVFGGEEYGTGSSRDWAAKGTQLLGVKAVIAKSFERIHRSNLVGMGVLPLQFKGMTAFNHWASRAMNSLTSGSGRHSSPAECNACYSRQRRLAPRNRPAMQDRYRHRGRILHAWRYIALCSQTSHAN